MLLCIETMKQDSVLKSAFDIRSIEKVTQVFVSLFLFLIQSTKNCEMICEQLIR